METFYTILALSVGYLLIPCRYDPLIRLREWNQRWDEKLRSRGRGN